MFYLHIDGEQILASDTVKPLLERLDMDAQLGFTTASIIEVD